MNLNFTQVSAMHPQLKNILDYTFLVTSHSRLPWATSNENGLKLKVIFFNFQTKTNKLL